MTEDKEYMGDGENEDDYMEQQERETQVEQEISNPLLNE